MTTELLNTIINEQVISIIITFILGFLLGLLIKKMVEAGTIILAIIIILIAIGAISPSTIIHVTESLTPYMEQAKSFAETQLHILPYDSLFFIIGFVVGLIKK